MEKTRNEAYGFYGTMYLDGCADEAWDSALTALAAETGAEQDEVRDFLDSRRGDISRIRCIAIWANIP